MATLPIILLNGTTADANDVMADLNELYTDIDSTNVAAANKTGTGKFVLQTSPTITTPAISAPVLSGTITGTYTLAGTPTITSPTISAPTFTGNATFDTDTLFVDATNNRVGVGTASPIKTLHVKTGAGGGATPDTATRILVENNSNAYMEFLTGNTDSAGLVFSDNAVFRGAIRYLHSNDSIELDTAGTTHMRLNSTGEMQLGTVNPPTANWLNSNSGIKGSAKLLWTGVTWTLAASYNVSSLTVGGSTDVTVNWDTDFSSANYFVSFANGQAYRDILVNSQLAASLQIVRASPSGAGDTIHLIAAGAQ